MNLTVWRLCLLRRIQGHHSHRIKRLQIKHNNILTNTLRRSKNSCPFELLTRTVSFRRKNKLSKRSSKNKDINHIRRVQSLIKRTAHITRHLLEELNNAVLAVNSNAQLNILKVVLNHL